MDILDRAQNIEAHHRALAIASARAAIAAGPGQEHCQNCEEPISLARRRAVPGCRLCINCQKELENERT
ncbi:MAG: TraR/DksA C4-type zinc finger protein [Desulfobacter sp.]|nr:TraR/DksA C4-type zinc finger protein [Desulfobacter sp.]WDP86150.1 MAG: TraR/DksA C4-type zinc finger protein [Desulfobacter sp.]